MCKKINDVKILLFRPRFIQAIVIAIPVKKIRRNPAMIIDMQEAKAALYGRKAKRSARRGRLILKRDFNR